MVPGPRHVVASLVLLLAFGVVVGAPGGGASSPPPEAPRYLALGDSLAAGYQPNAPSNLGYAERVWRHRARSERNLVLVKLGRGGETAVSMVRSSRPGPSQLERAEGILKGRRTALVTLDIGANEVEACRRGDGFDEGCVDRGLASLRRTLPRILRRLRIAGRGKVPIVGINYYNSFLGGWVRGAGGRRLARRSVSVERRINATLARAYHRAHVPMADVEQAFSTDQMDRYASLKRYGRVPVAVAQICRWTWSCEDDGDDHTNTAGYSVIARAVARVLDRR